MKIILMSNNVATDITEFTSSKVWGGDINSASRTLAFNVLTKNLNTKIELGQIILYVDNNNKVLFRGMIFSIDINKNGVYAIKCYDSMFYWVNNTDVFAFKNVTIGAVIKEMAKRFGIKLGKVEDVSYKIQSLPLQEMKLWDYFKNAEKEVWKHTGTRFTLRDNNGNAELLKRKSQVHKWIIEKGNLVDYSYSENAENLKTKVKLVNTEDKKTLTAMAQDNALIKKFGILQAYENATEKTNQATLNQKVKQMLKELGRPEKTFSLTCLGLNDVIAGDSVFVNIPELGIKRAYYVQKDTHNYNNKSHTMDLELKESLELN